MDDEAVDTIYDISGQRDTALASDNQTPLMPSLMGTSPRREEFLMQTQLKIIERQKHNPSIYKTGPTKY